MGTLTLTNLIPSIQIAMDTVSREQVGFIRAVSIDGGVSVDGKPSMAAVGQVVTSPIVGPMAAEDLIPAAYAGDTPDQSINSVQMEITRARSVSFGVSGEEYMGLNNAGTYDKINAARIAQALRTITNEVESDLAALHMYASRAYGTYNVVPFATAGDLTDFSGPRRILDDNGAPQSDLHMVLGSSAVDRIRGKQSTLFQTNTGGPLAEALLRRGALGEVSGFDLHNSGQVETSVAAGTNNGSATTDTTGYAIGSTSIGLASAGTGTIIDGDIITFANDSNKYIVKTGDSNVANGGTIVLQEPGLRQALPASAVTITTVAATTRNMFFHRSAIQLVTRAPAMPPGGDAAVDVLIQVDPVTDIAFEFCIYKQKRRLRYEVNLVWGVKMIAPRHCGVLIGA